MAVSPHVEKGQKRHERLKILDGFPGSRSCETSAVHHRPGKLELCTETFLVCLRIQLLELDRTSLEEIEELDHFVAPALVRHQPAIQTVDLEVLVSSPVGLFGDR